MTPNNVLGHAHDPTRDAGIAGINKFPPSPELVSRRRANFAGIVLAVATEGFFVTVVTLARVKCIIWVVLFDIGFECPSNASCGCTSSLLEMFLDAHIAIEFDEWHLLG